VNDTVCLVVATLPSKIIVLRREGSFSDLVFAAKTFQTSFTGEADAARPLTDVPILHQRPPDAVAFNQSLLDNARLSIKTTRSPDGKVKEGSFNLGAVSEIRSKIAKACD